MAGEEVENISEESESEAVKPELNDVNVAPIKKEYRRAGKMLVDSMARQGISSAGKSHSFLARVCLPISHLLPGIEARRYIDAVIRSSGGRVESVVRCAQIPGADYETPMREYLFNMAIIVSSESTVHKALSAFLTRFSKVSRGGLHDQLMIEIPKLTNTFNEIRMEDKEVGVVNMALGNCPNPGLFYVRGNYFTKTNNASSASMSRDPPPSPVSLTPSTHTTWSEAYQHASSWILLISLFSSMGLIIGLHLHARSVPLNYILLCAFTVSQALTLGVFVSLYNLRSVVEAACLTFVVVLGLFLFTLQSKRDFRKGHAIAFSLLSLLLMASIIQIIFQSPAFHFFVNLGGAALFCFFIIIDLDMIMKDMEAEDYILACVTLYLDVINLFMYILQIIGEANRQ